MRVKSCKIILVYVAENSFNFKNWILNKIEYSYHPTQILIYCYIWALPFLIRKHGQKKGNYSGRKERLIETLTEGCMFVFSFYIICAKELKWREIKRSSRTLSFFQCQIMSGCNRGECQGGLEQGWALHRFPKICYMALNRSVTWFCKLSAG